MNQVNSGLKSVDELLEYDFIIPSYQRGYRWKSEQVNDLLEDILEFHKKEKSTDEFYCLQPIVITKNKKDKKFIVIDGQQRLTTIYIILNQLKLYLDDQGKKLYSINYETRPGSKDFLENIDYDLAEENIDYYHMVEAAQTVEKWFVRTGAKMAILNALVGIDFNNVKVIWYELGKDSDPIEVFTRLNMGKIGLTNAELIKALFLSTSHKMTKKQKKKIKFRRHEIGAEWDSFEAKLRDEEFWGFLQNGKVSYDNHIELLFDLIADRKYYDGSRKGVDKYITFRFFSNRIKSVGKAWIEWDNVKRVFQQLHDWFTDKRLYHLIGFLISAGEDLNELRRDAEGLTKSAFFEHIRLLVGNYIKDDITTLTYQDDKSTLRNVLLLFNVLSILENPKTNLRFQFGRYKSESWDIEHIHSVASEMPASRAHQLDWLREVDSFTRERKLKKQVSNYLNTDAKDRDMTFEDLYEEVVRHYSEDERKDINDISNLALLDSGTNRGYKNAVFPIKRKTIIEKDEAGTFIPLCTKNVFLKYYNKKVDQTTFWGATDRKSYKKALIKTIKQYQKGKNYE